MIDLEKLKREWKTFVWGVVGISLELWDQVLAGMFDYNQLIPIEYQPVMHVAIPVGFFLLRKWKDEHTD